MSTIVDPQTHNGAKVAESGQLATFSIQESLADHATKEGISFNVNSGSVTITDANEAAIMYIKNTGDEDIIIPKVIYILGTSTGGSGDFKVAIYKNADGGTIVTDAAAVEVASNMNFGNNTEFASFAQAYKGGTGKTQTGGSKHIETIYASTGNRYSVDLGIASRIPKGTSITFVITPPTGNTSLEVQMACPCYINDSKLKDLE